MREAHRTRPRPTRAEKQARTRAALLESARRTAFQHGLEGASIDRIAAGAGYTKGAFYANFRSKEELFLAMLDQRFADELERLDRRLTGESEPAETARRASVEAIGRAGADPEWHRLYFEFVAYAARNEEFRRELATRQRALRERLTEIYGRWAEGFPEEPPLPMDEIAAMTDIMFDGFMLDKLIDPELGDEVYGTMVAVFVRGLQALAMGWEPPPATNGE
jgi:AcrR family transcriptional regulator